MAEYGVWLEACDIEADSGVAYGGIGAMVPQAREEARRLTWRGEAGSREQARGLAAQAWDDRFGAADQARRCYVLEILPGDAGYRG